MKTKNLKLPKVAYAFALAILLTPVASFAQLDLGINYQAVIRDAQGEPMVNQSVSLQFRIHAGSATGTIIFIDGHAATTTEHGLVSVVIGDGATTAGDLNNLNLTTTEYFLEVFVNSSSIGTQRLETVPTSLKATNMDLEDLVDVSTTNPTGGQVLQWDGTQWAPGALSGGSPWVTGSSGITYSNGNVGVGTNALALLRMGVTTGANNPLGLQINNNSTNSLAKYGLISTVGSSGSGTRYAVKGTATSPSSGAGAIYGVFGEAFQGSSSSATYGIYGDVTGNGSGERWAGYFNGDSKVVNDLEIGSKVSIRPTGQSSGGQIELRDNDGTATITINANEGTSQGGEIVMTDDAGNVTIDIDADFNGNGRIITDELQITGGSDLAEMFSSTSTSLLIEPGSVVVMDPEDPGSIKIAEKAHDRMVVGVVSGANGVRSGMLMGQKGSEAYGDVPVAIVGRVYVKANEANGAILPGDLLTSSSVPGHAMKVNEVHTTAGSILGKALTPIDQNGFVLMLVNLR